MPVNLSPGPAPLAHRPWISYLNDLEPGQPGYRLLTESHHSPCSIDFIKQLENKLLDSLSLNVTHRAIFVAGSARETFLRINRFLQSKQHQLTHEVTGYWSKWAQKHALPSDNATKNIARHICINETVDGLRSEPVFDQGLLVADCTSCLFTEEIDSRIDICYASGQKIFSFSGFSIIIIRKELLEKDDSCYEFASDIAHYAALTSKAVTPPLAGMLLLHHFLQWLSANGGVTWLADRTKQRAEIIYEILQDLPVKLVDSARRSRTSIVFHANTQEISHILNDQLKAAQVQYYHGHSAVGGFRLMNLPGLADEEFDELCHCLETIRGS